MSTADLTAPEFTNDDAAREALEGIRWANGVFCPHCGSFDSITRLGGKAGKEGRWHCRDCRKKFTVTVGTVYERSHIPLHKWLLATHLMASSKKGVSAHQLHRMLGITYKSAWFMAHRIREAMNDHGVGPLGGEGQHIEVDETYIGKKAHHEKPRGGHGHKLAVVSLVERGGRSKTVTVDSVTVDSLKPLLDQHADKRSILNTDEGQFYKKHGRKFAKHQVVKHATEEWVRGSATTNTVEGFFSIFKRGMKGVYQHCGEQHLHRYLAEFDFRYSNREKLGVNDKDRATKAVQGIEGKRLTYRRTDRQEAPSLG